MHSVCQVRVSRVLYSGEYALGLVRAPQVEYEKKEGGLCISVEKLSKPRCLECMDQAYATCVNTDCDVAFHVDLGEVRARVCVAFT